MKGYIKIEATTYEGCDGLSIETHLENVSYVDRLQVLHSVCHALKLNADDLDLTARMMRDGIFDSAVDIQDLRDDTEESDEDSSKHKEKSAPDVHVIGVGCGVDGLAARLKKLLS